VMIRQNGPSYIPIFTDTHVILMDPFPPLGPRMPAVQSSYMLILHVYSVHDRSE
jgi:hypothetical protein